MDSVFPLERARSATLHISIISKIRLLRESLARALEEQGSITVCGHFSDPTQALVEISEKKPDIVLLDEAFPDAHATVRHVRGATSRTLVVVMSVVETADEIVGWAEAGVAGYIPRTAGLAELIPLLEGVRKGEQTCAPEVAGTLLRRVSRVSTAGRGEQRHLPSSQLTAREKQILQLIAAGKGNKEIARSLNIGVATTKTHVHHLLTKMNLTRRYQAAKYAGDYCGDF